jgi:hypothetical protein
LSERPYGGVVLTILGDLFLKVIIDLRYELEYKLQIFALKITIKFSRPAESSLLNQSVIEGVMASPLQVD